ncbi:hypothetical protein QAD02_009362, partial [Eretmocerus hayati]
QYLDREVEMKSSFLLGLLVCGVVTICATSDPTTEYPDSATEVSANDDTWNSQNLRRESRAARGPTAKQLYAYISAQNSKVYNPRGYELAWRIHCPDVKPLEMRSFVGLPLLRDFAEGMGIRQ